MTVVVEQDGGGCRGKPIALTIDQMNGEIIYKSMVINNIITQRDRARRL